MEPDGHSTKCGGSLLVRIQSVVCRSTSTSTRKCVAEYRLVESLFHFVCDRNYIAVLVPIVAYFSGHWCQFVSTFVVYCRAKLVGYLVFWRRRADREQRVDWTAGCGQTRVNK